jgi:hypothetical protein
VRAHEVITAGDRVIAVELHGLLQPPRGIAAPKPADITLARISHSLADFCAAR